MPRGKRKGTEVRRQVRLAVRYVDRIVDHLMAADIVAKGGTIQGHGKMLPRGVDIRNPEHEGHPVLNQWLPVLLELLAGVRSALSSLVKNL